RRGGLPLPDRDLPGQRLAGGAVLPVHLRGSPDQGVQRQRPQHAHRRGQAPVPYRGARRLPDSSARPQAHLREGAEPRARRAEVGLGPGRRRLPLLGARGDMGDWVRWAAPPAIVVSIAAPSHATQYLTVEQAERLAFPAATRFVEAHVGFKPSEGAEIERRSGEKGRTRGQQVWRAFANDQPIGFLIVDYVIGKHLVIDYAGAVRTDEVR